MKASKFCVLLMVFSFVNSTCHKPSDESKDENPFYFCEQAFPGVRGELHTFIVNGDSIVIEEVNGKFVFQGDIILTKEQLTSDSLKGAGLKLNTYRWPLGIVYYKINESFSDKSAITDAIQEYEDKTPLKFIERTNQPNYVEFISFESTTLGGYSSNFGMTGVRQEIGLVNVSNKGTVIHEIGHTIGLVHEHSREDRNKYIIVNYQNIDPNPAIQCQFYPTFTQIISLDFDFSSIMLYDSYAFNINGEPTITKIDGSTFNAQRRKLSDLDIATIYAMYNFIYSPPSVNTLLTDITQSSAVFGCEVTSNGGAKVTERGFFWGTSSEPEKTGTKQILSFADGVGSISIKLGTLKEGTKYYVKAYAINTINTGYGVEKSFTTTVEVVKPSVTTTSVSDHNFHSASVGGIVTNNGGGIITECGVYWGISSNPIINGTKLKISDSGGSFSTTLNGLTPGKTYYLVAYTINSAGVGYGDQVSFTLPQAIGFNPNINYGSLTDAAGNVYRTVQIGTQTWMAENLNIGTIIDKSVNQIDNQIIEKYCFCNSRDSCDIYGGMYQWNEMMNFKIGEKSQGICPTGWHIPDKSDWEILLNKIASDGYGQSPGKALKSIDGWESGNGIDIYGFGVLPSGYRTTDGAFYGKSARFWSSTPYWNVYIEWWQDNLSWYNLYDSNNQAMDLAATIRCIKN